LNETILNHLFPETIYHLPPRVVVIVARPWETYAPEEKALLSKILASVRLSPATVQIITQPALSLASLAAYAPSKVLVFGSQSEGLRSYEAAQAQGFTVLKADDLPALDDAKKKNLWLALKNMFGV
jgi:DNA polymerase III psi subunit